MFRWFNNASNFLLTELDGNPITCLDSLIDALPSLLDNKPVGYRYLELGSSQPKSGILYVDRHFFDTSLYTLHPLSWWERQVLSPPALAPSLETSNDVKPDLDDSCATHNLVMVECHVPISIAVTS